jgi:hypothetical protein
MDKVEQYLDQVCRSVGGPRALRQHIRQELREHLLDAVAEHKAAGLAEEAALERALADFGGPEQVRSELEATHGQRLLPVVIDKAMQWKEKTMRAKWLWTTWAYLAVAGVIAMDLLFILFSSTMLLPKLQKLKADGWLQLDDTTEPAGSRMLSFLNTLPWLGEYWWCVLFPAAGWVVFEWRVRSENKSFMRMSALGTVAAGMTLVVIVAGASMAILFVLGLPGSKIARPWAVESIVSIDTSVAAVEKALEQKDWAAMQEQADRASKGMNRLESGPSLYALTNRDVPPTAAELRVNQKSAKESLAEVQQAIREKESDRLKTALQKFQQSFAPLREAAKKRDQ